MGCASVEVMAKGELWACKSAEGRAELQSSRASAGRDSLFPVQPYIVLHPGNTSAYCD